MIYPKKSPFIQFFLRQYARWVTGRHFREILFNPITIDKNKSILLVANHFSFWDGLILYIVNHLLFKKRFHAMMGEDTAKMIYFLKFGGVFTINKNSRQVLESLNYAAKLLATPNNLVLIYPQGKLYSNFVNDVHFEKGVQRIIDQADGKFQLVFAASFIQYFKHKKPTVTVYLKNNNESYAGKNITELKNAYQQHYNDAKLQQTEIEV